MNTLSAPLPLTPPDADLQDFAFMPLHVARLRDSDLAAEAAPEACWYAVLLWAASWHQLPAGSLPDNDAVLARLCGLGRDLRTFKKHRADAMRGFVRCSDGRLYHPVVAEQVVAAWQKKLEQRWRTELARIKKANQRNGTDLPSPTFDEFIAGDKAIPVPDVSPGTTADVPGEITSKRQGEGQGQGEYSSDANASGAAAPPAVIDPEKVMFDAGRTLLTSAGISIEAAGRLLGRWKRDHGAEAVIIALGKAQREGAIDPKSFIEGCLRNGQRSLSAGRGGDGFLAAVIDAERDDRAG
ncbi:hypothetical protein HNP52_000333 [Sphingomonas kyeonggiensis]|uniref:DUF1376 domain-containing protein n=1 Tax=Sphingomonas kyeonggiensis TaxID=1268553 RepID=A0A7W7JYE5_9SPHN|nr:DUF1376 domain-containing protein [Sphingomonas kyeonggiensis]MBB4837282.1 hypothetical protein [Sphingomonas kyeonggiensis]